MAWRGKYCLANEKSEKKECKQKESIKVKDEKAAKER
jgi:hypothetical protein